MRKPTAPQRDANREWEFVTFRVHPKMKVQIIALMKLGLFTTYREYFVFLVRQELKTARVEIVQKQKV